MGALLVVVVPGLAALLLVVAARSALRLRGLVAVLLVGLGVAAYAYQPGRTASEALIVTLVLAGVAVVAAGPLVAAPLCALAGLIGAEFVSRLVANRGALSDSVAAGVHQAVYHTGGSSLALHAGVLVLAAVPFAVSRPADLVTVGTSPAGKVLTLASPRSVGDDSDWCGTQRYDHGVTRTCGATGASLPPVAARLPA